MSFFIDAPPYDDMTFPTIDAAKRFAESRFASGYRASIYKDDGNYTPVGEVCNQHDFMVNGERFRSLPIARDAADRLWVERGILAEIRKVDALTESEQVEE